MRGDKIRLYNRLLDKITQVRLIAYEHFAYIYYDGQSIINTVSSDKALDGNFATFIKMKKS